MNIRRTQKEEANLRPNLDPGKRIGPEEMKQYVEPMFDVPDFKTEQEHNVHCESVEGM